jgi:hypothetical protein
MGMRQNVCSRITLGTPGERTGLEHGWGAAPHELSYTERYSMPKWHPYSCRFSNHIEVTIHVILGGGKPKRNPRGPLRGLFLFGGRHQLQMDFYKYPQYCRRPPRALASLGDGTRARAPADPTGCPTASETQDSDRRSIQPGRCSRHVVEPTAKERPDRLGAGVMAKYSVDSLKHLPQLRARRALLAVKRLRLLLARLARLVRKSTNCRHVSLPRPRM